MEVEQVAAVAAVEEDRKDEEKALEVSHEGENIPAGGELNDESKKETEASEEVHEVEKAHREGEHLHASVPEDEQEREEAKIEAIHQIDPTNEATKEEDVKIESEVPSKELQKVDEQSSANPQEEEKGEILKEEQEEKNQEVQQIQPERELIREDTQKVDEEAVNPQGEEKKDEAANPQAEEEKGEEEQEEKKEEVQQTQPETEPIKEEPRVEAIQDDKTTDPDHPTATVHPLQVVEEVDTVLTPQKEDGDKEKGKAKETEKEGSEVADEELEGDDFDEITFNDDKHKSTITITRPKGKSEAPVAEWIDPDWVPDEQASKCFDCEQEFTLFKRRHHCRGCGKIYCHPCSNNWLLFPANSKYQKVQRTCKSCYKACSNLDHSKTYDEYMPENPRATIVLVHGATACRKCFYYQVASFKDQYHLLVPDMPGHGSRAGEPLSMESAIEAIAQLVQERAIGGKAIIYGYSMGGFITMAFGAAHPELCLGLVVGGANGNMKKAATFLTFMGFTYKVLSKKRLASLVEDTAGFVLKAQISKEVMREAIMRCGCYYEKWDEIKGLMLSTDYEECLRNIHKPILFLVGEKDIRDGEELNMATAKNAELKVVPEGTHAMLLDDRFHKECDEAALAFFDGVAKGQDLLSSQEL